jgi:Co/Zn/Cd efflux system component
LRADALDFLADALNYAIALAVIGLSLRWRAGAALIKGGIMALFGLWVAGSIVNNAMIRAVPDAEVIGAVGLVALVANVSVAALLYRHRASDSQAMSVWLCTRNDCIANIGVILAGIGVWISGTPWPDIGVAGIVAYLGVSSAVRIARRAIVEMRSSHAFIGAPAE